MRAQLLCVAASWFAVVCGGAARAQVQPCTPGGMIGGSMIGVGVSRANIPFSGVVKLSIEQKLADGNAIHRVTQTRQARDSAGRTMNETAVGCVRGEDGQMHEQLTVNINDPVARTNMNWQVGVNDQLKVVHVFHQPELKPVNSPPVVKRPEPTAAQQEQQQKMVKAIQARALLERRETRTEDLGVKDFNGVSAQGLRTTRTIPPGEEGNDLPLVVVNETWRSKELGLLVMVVRDDPRTGRTVTEFEEFTRGEPDPGLFAPPAGYTMQEQPQNGFLGGIAMGIGTSF